MPGAAPAARVRKRLPSMGGIEPESSLLPESVGAAMHVVPAVGLLDADGTFGRLTVGAANDPLEHAADAAADRALARLGGPAEAIQSGPTTAHDVVHRASRSAGQGASTTPPVVGAAGGPLSDEVSQQISDARGSGRPLSATESSRMETGFGQGFSGVRIHDDDRATALSRSLSALAFTAGTDVFVDHDQYRPGTESSERMLAHELAHTLQGTTQIGRLHNPFKKKASSTTQVQAHARSAVSGVGEPLPFRAKIQAAFGAHDISDVRSHVDSAAADGAGAMGAKAFTLGNDIAFAREPDLHTAAHEAAHIVQQRAGVSLSSGVGSDGDSYERVAERVADSVERGQSVDSILGTPVPGGFAAPHPAVQMLTDDEVDQLETYIRDLIDETPLSRTQKVIRDKAVELGKLYTARKAMDKAKQAARDWVASEVSSRAASAKESAKETDSGSTTPEPTPLVETAKKPGAEEPKAEQSSTKKKAKPKKITWGELTESFPASRPALDYGKAGATGSKAPTPQAQPKSTVSAAADTAWKNFTAWKPSEGHGGCKALTLTAADLHFLAGKVDDSKYYLVWGKGTGEAYKDKNQFKIIHGKMPIVAGTGKKPTFHITVKEGALSTFAGESSLPEED